MRRCTITLLALVLVAFSGALLQAGSIHKAAESGDLETVRAMLEKQPALLGATDERGNTPLHHAAFKGHLEVV